jgi:hypothetical protein
MDDAASRQVVVEIEHTQIVRKRAKTYLKHCRECRQERDFLPVKGASTLFSIEQTTLIEFAIENHCHYSIDESGDIQLCLTRLLAQMSRRMEKGKYKQIGG